MTKNLMKRQLPKWPRMLVTGTAVTQEQALEIIRRTDTYFQYESGNDRAFKAEAARMIGRPPETPYYDEAWLDEKGERDQRKYAKAAAERWGKDQLWQQAWGVIQTEYVYNSWISSSYIGGPTGWCHPDGSILHTNSVGSKWPSVQQVYNEWSALAKEFPFLEVEVTLFADETCESAAVSFMVRNGEVVLVDPVKRDIHKEADRQFCIDNLPEDDDSDFNVRDVLGFHGEHAISLQQIKEWGEAFHP